MPHLTVTVPTAASGGEAGGGLWLEQDGSASFGSLGTEASELLGESVTIALQLPTAERP